MQGWMGLCGVALLLAGTAAAQEAVAVGGKQISVATDGMGSAALSVDGAVVLESGVIFLDPEAQVIGGVPVLTGVAGSGGNACGAAPFVLALPEGGSPGLYGPIDSCRAFTMQVQPDGLVFATEALPAEPGEIWVWNPITGLTEALPEEFAADPALGWDALPTLAGAHPVEAMRLDGVLAALQGGLSGEDYTAFAERISDLGSGDLTATGYLGEACLKFTCDADWALLYLDAKTQSVYAIWHVSGDIENRIFPQDTTLWSEDAMQILREKAGP
ncbi:MAG: hypothetical protein EAZ40_11025 [Rhodobacterales bacterium]|nr:MAG: hypothetical protein EAZ40_11025 [Rhodobacterales bacterium]